MENMSKRHPIPEISSIIERWHPNASIEEKKDYTRDLRQFIVALVALNEKLREGASDGDSPESGTHDILESH